MLHLGPFSVVIAFIVFLTVTAVAGIVAEYKKRGLAIEPLRAAIERGQSLDPALIERLMAPPETGKPVNHLYLKVAGIITVASGVGLALLSFFVAKIAPEALYPSLGSGVVAVCVGVGLMIAARVVERDAKRQAVRGP